MTISMWSIQPIPGPGALFADFRLIGTSGIVRVFSRAQLAVSFSSQRVHLVRQLGKHASRKSKKPDSGELSKISGTEIAEVK